MACGKLVVSTQVGDVSWLFEDGKGLFLAEQNADSFARSISAALEFGKLNEMRSNGRERILMIQLTSGQIAQRLVHIYSDICETESK
jgi:glycosyltransferase involved in cell wall biosynthesis